MKYSTHKSFIRAWRGVALLIAAGLATAAATPVHAEDAEIATTSDLAGIRLPDATVRMTDRDTIDKLMTPIRDAAKGYNMKVAEAEVLAWQDPEGGAAGVKKQIINSLKGAGYETEDMGDDVKTEAGTMNFFIAKKINPTTGIFAYWIDNKEALILNWAKMAKTGDPIPDKPAVKKPTAPAVEAPVKRPSNSGGGNLKGTWAMTTISGTTYWDKGTGAYLGNGFGGSQTYTFLPNGKFKFFNYIKTRMYNWETQALTWQEGTYTVSGNKIDIVPTEGKYQVIDNQVQKSNYTRPMKPEEIKKQEKTRYFEITRDDKGQPVLKLSDTEGGSASTFRYREDE